MPKLFKNNFMSLSGFVQAGFSRRSIGAGKEELLDYYHAQFAPRALLKSLLEKRDLGRLLLP